MAGDGVPEQPGVGGGWEVDSGRGRRKSAEFIQKTQLFEGSVGSKGELLVVDCPEKPKCAYKNFSEII